MAIGHVLLWLSCLAHVSRSAMQPRPRRRRADIREHARLWFCSAGLEVAAAPGAAPEVPSAPPASAAPSPGRCCSRCDTCPRHDASLKSGSFFPTGCLLACTPRCRSNKSHKQTMATSCWLTQHSSNLLMNHLLPQRGVAEAQLRNLRHEGGVERLGGASGALLN